MKKAALHNLGCKVNAYETEAMQQMLEQAGYEIVPFDEKADVYIINTCSVTNMADRKSRQMLHRAKKKNPGSVVVAAGCYVQTSPGQAQADPAVDILIGNNKKHELPEILERFWAGQREIAPGQAAEEKMSGELYTERKSAFAEGQENRKDAEGQESRKDAEGQESRKNAEGQESRKNAEGQESRKNPIGKYQAIEDIAADKEYERLQISRTAEHTRAFLKVQDGCNQFCSYCIIPFARGRVRSRKLSDVMQEVQSLAANGYQEVVLTGIHLSSYGIGMEKAAAKDSTVKDAMAGTSGQQENIGLLDLIRSVHAVQGIARIRLGSLEPQIITEDFVRELSRLPKVCPHFHLSLQSGCDATLKRMNRRYSCQEYEERCRLLRKYFQHPAITTDVIVGFPGETEEEFAATREFLANIGFFEMHIFKYSLREGTRAARMPGQVAEEIKARRSETLFADAAPRNRQFLEWYLGKETEVLIEEKTLIGGRPYYIGHTKEYVKAALPIETDTAPDLINHLVKGRGASLLGQDTLVLL